MGWLTNLIYDQGYVNVGVQNVEPTSYGRLGNMMSSIGFGDKFAWADKCFNCFCSQIMGNMLCRQSLRVGPGM